MKLFAHDWDLLRDWCRRCAVTSELLYEYELLLTPVRCTPSINPRIPQ